MCDQAGVYVIEEIMYLQSLSKLDLDLPPT